MGSSATIEDSIEMNSSIESAFDFIADPRNDSQWCPRVLWCEQHEGVGPGLGARYEALHRPTLRRRHKRSIDVVAFEPPKRIRTTQEDEIGIFEITYLLEPTAHGARLTQRDEIAWKIPRAYLPVARRIVRRHIGEQLASLKRLLETGAARPAGATRPL